MIKKRQKVSAEFSMSSLTDIIFLLLIFFMLTSNFVRIHPFDLPESDSKTVAAQDLVVQITRDGEMTVNNNEATASNVYRFLQQESRRAEDKSQVTVTIVAEKGTPFRQVQSVIEAAGRLRLKAVLATQPKS